MADQHDVHKAYQLLPHGPALQVINNIIAVDKHSINCTVAPTQDNPLHEHNTQVASFICVEYAAQAAAIHAILMGAHYDPLKPAYIGAVKDLCLLRTTYTKNQTVRIKAEQEYSENDGAIYSFSGFADDEALITGRLILKK